MAAQLINLADYEAAARDRLPREIWDFIAGGSMDGISLRRNRSAFEALALQPRNLRDVTSRDLRTTVLGTPVSMPIIVSPAGVQAAADPEAEVATARGVGLSDTIMTVPMGANRALADIAAAATGPLWQQVYHRSREHTEGVVRQAEALGFAAICLTCDVPVYSLKERDQRNGFDVLRYAQTGDVAGSVAPYPAMAFAAQPREPLTWREVEWLRGLTKLPIVLKGLTHPDDARIGADAGANAVMVSTHGGRIVDGTLSALESLPSVVDAVGSRVEVYLDSGVRRGSDALKALALGARAVGVARPFLWGLAVDGAQGVHAVLEILRAEFDLALAFCGHTDVAGITPDTVHVPLGWGLSAGR